MVGKDVFSFNLEMVSASGSLETSLLVEDKLLAHSHTQLLQRRLKRGFTENKSELKNRFKYKCSFLLRFSVQHLAFISNGLKKYLYI